MIFTWEQFRVGDIAVHCPTEEEAIFFCDQSHRNGIDWCDSTSRLEITNWKNYKDQTCYRGGHYGTMNLYQGTYHIPVYECVDTFPNSIEPPTIIDESEIL